MAAELAQVDDRTGRWRFAAGALRVALFLPSGCGRRMMAVALAGLLASAAATATSWSAWCCIPSCCVVSR